MRFDSKTAVLTCLLSCITIGCFSQSASDVAEPEQGPYAFFYQPDGITVYSTNPESPGECGYTDLFAAGESKDGSNHRVGGHAVEMFDFRPNYLYYGAQ